MLVSTFGTVTKRSALEVVRHDDCGVARRWALGVSIYEIRSCFVIS